MTEDGLALGTEVFTRDEELRELLSSIPDVVDKVYVADDGESSKSKEEIYNAEYEFAFELIDMEYDAGLGAGRKAIVEALSEEYLIICDTDHRVPSNVSWLLCCVE